MLLPKVRLRIVALMACAVPGLLSAQITPAPGWCSMAHCNPQMSDFVQQMPPGINGSVYVKTSDQFNAGVSVGDGCIGNGARVACAYRQSWNALTVFDGNGNMLWGSGGLLDNHTYSGLPIMQADGSVVAGDDQHLIGFNPDGSVAWITPSPGGTPIGLVPTPNGAIVTATASQQLNQCWQGNCTLAFNITNGGSGYTTASVILAGGYCPGATATATISGGAITAVAAASQGPDCDVAPDAIVIGDGRGAAVSAVLNAAAPVIVYGAATGGVVGSTYLYQTGNSGPYYATINTPCVNNGSYPNRLYVLTGLASDQTQGAIWALDIDPANPASPITPAWNLIIHGPSGASPLCVGNQIYFDGAGILPGDNVGTTVFGVQDNGASGAFSFQTALGPGTQKITCNFAVDPRPVGGFWHQVQYDPNIYHRDFNTGNLIETINVSNLLTASGAPPSTYWQAGIFTEYGTPAQPYLMLPEAAYPNKPGSAGYLAMLDVNAQRLVWTVPLAGNDLAGFDSPGGDAVLVLDSNQNPVIVMSGKQTGAYFITNGGPDSSVSPGRLSFGPQVAGTTSPPQSLTLFNSASAVLSIGSIAAGAPFSAQNNCGAALAPGASCTIAVTFNPAAAGTQNGAVTITSNSQSSPQTVPVDGHRDLRRAGCGAFGKPIEPARAGGWHSQSAPGGDATKYRLGGAGHRRHLRYRCGGPGQQLPHEPRAGRQLHDQRDACRAPHRSMQRNRYRKQQCTRRGAERCRRCHLPGAARGRIGVVHFHPGVRPANRRHGESVSNRDAEQYRYAQPQYRVDRGNRRCDRDEYLRLFAGSGRHMHDRHRVCPGHPRPAHRHCDGHRCRLGQSTHHLDFRCGTAESSTHREPAPASHRRSARHAGPDPDGEWNRVRARLGSLLEWNPARHATDHSLATVGLAHRSRLGQSWHGVGQRGQPESRRRAV